MSMLRDDIQNQMKTAMREKDQVALAALKYAWSLIRDAEIDKKADLNDEEIVGLLQKEVKTRKEAMTEFAKMGRDDLVKSEQEKLVILEALLPAQMSREEVERVVDEVVGRGEAEFGKIMGQVMGKLKGKADGTLVSAVVREKLGA